MCKEGSFQIFKIQQACAQKIHSAAGRRKREKRKDHRRQVGFTYKIAAMTGGKIL